MFVSVLKSRIYLKARLSKVLFFEWVSRVVVKKARKTENIPEAFKKC